MNTLHIPLSLSLLFSFTASLMSADKDSKIGWPSYRPKNPIVYTPQPQLPIREQYPITLGLLLAEIKRTSAASIKQRVEIALTEHRKEYPHGDVIRDEQNCRISKILPNLLTLNNYFDETMTDPFAQKVIALVIQKETTHKPDVEQETNKIRFNLGQCNLDDFTTYDTLLKYDIHTESSIRFVNCTTTLHKMADVEAFLAEAEKGTNQ